SSAHPCPLVDSRIVFPEIIKRSAVTLPAKNPKLLLLIFPMRITLSSARRIGRIAYALCSIHRDRRTAASFHPCPFIGSRSITPHIFHFAHRAPFAAKQPEVIA